MAERSQSVIDIDRGKSVLAAVFRDYSTQSVTFKCWRCDVVVSLEEVNFRCRKNHRSQENKFIPRIVINVRDVFEGIILHGVWII